MDNWYLAAQGQTVLDLVAGWSLRCTVRRPIGVWILSDRIGRRPCYQGPFESHLPSVDNEKSAKSKQHQMTIAQWNVRTLLDREYTDRPERRTTLVAMVLHKYNIDIAVLSDTRFHSSSSLNDLEYTFYWSGKPNG